MSLVMQDHEIFIEGSISGPLRRARHCRLIQPTPALPQSQDCLKVPNCACGEDVVLGNVVFEAVRTF